MMEFKKSKSGNYYGRDENKLFLTTVEPSESTIFIPTSEKTDAGDDIWWNIEDIIISNNLISSNEALFISNSRRNEFLFTKVGEFITLCEDLIKESANNMKYDTCLSVNNLEYRPQIFKILEINLNRLGYRTCVEKNNDTNCLTIRIYWSDSTKLNY